MRAFRLKKDWTELGATWNCAIDSDTSNKKADCSGVTQWSMGAVPPNPWVTPATSQVGIAPTQTGTVSFDVMADVQGFLSEAFNDYGWMLWSGTAAEFVDFTSRETSTPPRLVLTVQRCSPALCDDGNSCTVDTCDSAATACIRRLPTAPRATTATLAPRSMLAKPAAASDRARSSARRRINVMRLVCAIPATARAASPQHPTARRATTATLAREETFA